MNRKLIASKAGYDHRESRIYFHITRDDIMKRGCFKEMPSWKKEEREDKIFRLF